MEKNFTKMLSGVRRDPATGLIVAAKATNMMWLSSMNITEVLENPRGDRGEPVDDPTLEFEGAMIDVLLNQTHYPAGLRAFPNVARSFGDIAGETILGDVLNMVVGYMILTAYVQLMLGRINCVENRYVLNFLR